jgi:uncharacterized protein YodC (DUF2158 family)
MEPFSVGSVVKLKSGGPQMTVSGYGKKMDTKSWLGTQVEDKEQIVCQWFDSIGTLLEGTFPVVSLKQDA